jgi:hypothetical protein
MDEDNENLLKNIVTVTAAGPVPGGEDILVALYPRGTGEAAPTYETLAPGVVRIVTGEGTDYAFLSVEPIAFANDLFSFQGRAGAVRVYPDEVHLVVNEGPGAIEYYGGNHVAGAAPLARLEADAAGKFLVFRDGRATEEDMDRGLRGYVERVVSSTDAAAPYRAEELPDVPPIPADPRDFLANRSGVRLASNDAGLPEGVTHWTFDGGFGWVFDAPAPLDFKADGDTAFQGKRGAIVVDEAGDEVSFLLLEADYAARDRLRAWGDAAGGSALLVYRRDRIVGRTTGIGWLLHATAPAGLDRLPMYVVDGQTNAPGTLGDRLVLPALPGEHVFSVETLRQPPVFRDWQRRPEP